MGRKIASSLGVLLFLVFFAGCQAGYHLQPQQSVEIEITVPDPAWQVEIERIYEGESALHVVSRLRRDPNVMAAQVISTVSDSVEIPSRRNLPVEHYVLGRTWGWAEEDYRFVESEQELQQLIGNKRLVFERGR